MWPQFRYLSVFVFFVSFFLCCFRQTTSAAIFRILIFCNPVLPPAFCFDRGCSDSGMIIPITRLRFNVTHNDPDTFFLCDRPFLLLFAMQRPVPQRSLLLDYLLAMSVTCLLILKYLLHLDVPCGPPGGSHIEL